MKPETLAALTRQAEETYPIQWPLDNSDDEELRIIHDSNAGKRSQQKAFISGATLYAEKMEAIRAEVEERIADYENRDPLFFTQEQIKHTVQQKIEAKSILEIIDKHLA